MSQGAPSVLLLLILLDCDSFLGNNSQLIGPDWTGKDLSRGLFKRSLEKSILQYYKWQSNLYNKFVRVLLCKGTVQYVMEFIIK